MSGLAPPTLRLDQPSPDALDDANIVVEASDDDQDQPDIDPQGNILRIEHGDGSLTLSLDGSPLGNANGPAAPTGWFDNLVDKIDAMELQRIVGELDRGIRDDIDSRKEWIESHALGIKLLGLKIEIPGLQGASDGAPVEGMSKVRHPLLLEAVLRFQANARGELLPADGPVKIRNDSTQDTLLEDQQANDLETDLNHYLTAVATEYYPDTDRMLLMLGFGGTSFKKIYFCPLRSRPVSESVDADNLIVNNAATDLRNAKRVTHKSMMKQSTVKRLQILGVYRDIDLSRPDAPKIDALKQEKNSQQGIEDESSNPDDRDREMYECYCELDIKGFEHKFKGRPSGLEIPYRVTMDASTKEILAIVRNYDEDDKPLPSARDVFVKYTFVPGLGFYDIGLLHILGNTTNALTAAWREMLDNGMYANFPGFLLADTGGRQNTNIFRIPPGGGALVKTGGMKMSEAVMPLPYNTSGQAALQSLVTDMAQTGMRIGGTSEQQVGEGRADAPVGTTLAMIDQATKMLNAVHKRMHTAQAEEFKLLSRCFEEHPESFLAAKCKSKTKWDEATFLAALKNCNLVPQADPNTASQTQRLMKIAALKMLQAAQPQMYNPIAVDTAAIQALGFSNPEQFFAPASAMGSPPPELQKMQAETQIKKQDADTRTAEANAKLAETKAKIAQGAFAPKPGVAPTDPDHMSPVEAIDAHAKLLDAQTRAKALGIKVHETTIEDQNRDKDRESREKVQLMELIREITMHPEAKETLPGVTKEVNTELGDKT